MNVRDFRFLHVTSSFSTKRLAIFEETGIIRNKQSQVLGIDRNCTMLMFNIPVSIDSLVEITCMFPFKFASARCQDPFTVGQVPVFIFHQSTYKMTYSCNTTSV